MPRSITLGNGKVLVGFDSRGQIRDLYYHYAGLENHVSENLVHRIGVWANDELTWFDDDSWNIEVNCAKDTMASEIVAENSDLGLKIKIDDVVYNEKDIFIRQFEVENLFDVRREIKFYFNQQFNISQTHTGDTAYFDPDQNAIIHYKGRRVFLVNAHDGEKSFKNYSVGIFGIEGKDGTFKDAEDGELTNNPIEHGQVDSVIEMKVELEPKNSSTFNYWMAIGKSVEKVKKLDSYIIGRKPSEITKTTKDYWDAWVHNQNFSFYGLGPPIVSLFNKSLIMIRTHVNKNGSIIASCDSDMLQYGRDTYSYVWPRDAAVAATALAKAGDFNASRRFFEYCNDVITKEGYFFHKYRPDKSVGSSWHPWVRNGKRQLPIQEDETALVINALWTHFELSKDLEFIEGFYNSLIKNAAEFMVDYRDEKTGLPKPSYDLWEMKYGIHTFTAASVFGALMVANKFADLLGKKKSAQKYKKAAEEIRSGIFEHLYDKKEGVFYKSIREDNGERTIDKVLDASSVYGIYKFKLLPYDDPKLKKAMEKTRDRLSVKTDIGGIARFENDIYHKRHGNIPGNPWIITTLWFTQYDSEFLKKEQDLPEFVKKFTWVVDRALSSGVLPEQIDPVTNEPRSAAPLTWSHAEYVISVVQYLEKLEELGICKACYPIDK